MALKVEYRSVALWPGPSRIELPDQPQPGLRRSSTVFRGERDGGKVCAPSAQAAAMRTKTVQGGEFGRDGHVDGHHLGAQIDQTSEFVKQRQVGSNTPDAVPHDHIGCAQPGSGDPRGVAGAEPICASSQRHRQPGPTVGGQTVEELRSVQSERRPAGDGALRQAQALFEGALLGKVVAH